MRQPESVIQNQILSWLRMKNIFAWPIKNSASFDPKLKRFRKPSAHFRRGVSDILGIHQGKPLAIEVKSEKGKLRPEQLEFLKEFKAQGGIVCVARSVEDVQKALGEAGVCL